MIAPVGSSVAGFGAAVSAPVIAPAPDPATTLVIEAVFPSASSGARPVGFGGGPGPRIGDDIGQADSGSVDDQTEGFSSSSGFPAMSVVEIELPEIDSGGQAADDKNPVTASAIDGGNTFAHLSGSALSGAFSKALMGSSLPAAEKARVLTEVTSETDPQLKERLRREWLSKLNS